MSGSSGGGGTTTVSQTAIPDWQQGAVQANEQLATSLAAQPYPNYQGQLIAGFTPGQTQGMQMANTAATAQQPDLTSAENLTNQAAGNTWNAQTAQQYMSPYAQSALAPQIQQLQQQQAQNNQQIGAQATQAGAFGDARQGTQQALNNFYGNLSMNDLEQQGMNSAYTTGQQAFNSENQNLLNSGSQMANLGQAQQSTGIAGANAVFGAGTQQQQLNQSQLTEAYQNFMNQVNWPYQQLNTQIASTANSPYQVPTANLAPSNATAQNLGAFASLAGGLGGLLGGSSSSAGSGNSALAGFSDRRLKKNIKKIGKLLSGLPLYTFQYIWDEMPYLGVMADEVEGVIPDAVFLHSSGYKMVDYARIY